MKKEQRATQNVGEPGTAAEDYFIKHGHFHKSSTAAVLGLPMFRVSRSSGTAAVLGSPPFRVSRSSAVPGES